MFTNGHVRTIPPTAEPAPAVVATSSSPPWWFQVGAAAGVTLAIPAVGIGLVAYVGLCFRVLRMTGGF